MITIKVKICKDCKRLRSLFSHGRCINCYKKWYALKENKTKPKYRKEKVKKEFPQKKKLSKRNLKIIREDKKFIPYELAKIAKEKGFNEDCFRFYNEKGLMQNVQMNHDCISAPLYQQIVDWFRGKHDLHIYVYKLHSKYDYAVEKDNRYVCVHAEYYNTYYEAINKAIEEAFKLI